MQVITGTYDDDLVPVNQSSVVVPEEVSEMLSGFVTGDYILIDTSENYFEYASYGTDDFIQFIL